MNFTTIENALRAWVVAASGYPEGRVIWADQNGPRPTGDVITMQLRDIVTLGAADEIIETTDLGRPAGQEVEVKAEGMREFACLLQCYTEATNGDSSGRAVLTRVQTHLGLPTVGDALKAAGVSVHDRGTVQYVPGIANTNFEGRATLEVQCNGSDAAVEYVGYIATVTGPTGTYS